MYDTGDNLRNSGIQAIGDVPWGARLCQLFNTRADLADILPPFFKAGLEGREFCLCVTAPPLQSVAVKNLLSRIVPDIDKYVAGGQIEILPHQRVFLTDGRFDAKRAASLIKEKHRLAIERGFQGLRLAVNYSWVEPFQWREFAASEAAIDRIVSERSIISLGSYFLKKCDPQTILHVIASNELALVRQADGWQTIEYTQGRQLRADLLSSREQATRDQAFVMDAVSEAIISTGPDFSVRTWNRAAEQMLGWKAAEVTGRNARDVLGVESPLPGGQTLQEAQEELLAKGVWSGEVVYHRKNGSPVVVWSIRTLLRDPQGRSSGMVIAARDITEQKRARQAIEDLARFPLENPSPVLRAAADGTLMFANESSGPLCTLWGVEQGDILPEDCRRTITAALSTAAVQTFEAKAGGRLFSIGFVPVAARSYVNIYGLDITERHAAESEVNVAHRFLQIANEQTEIRPLLQAFVTETANWTGCQAVGIRLLDVDGKIPYVAYKGFTRRFYEKESPLNIQSDKCICTTVVRGETDPAKPFYTQYGSFDVNSMSQYLASVSEQEKGSMRNACNMAGYESVALVPVRAHNQIIGLVHLADKRENMVPLELVRQVERNATVIGVAVQRLVAQQSLRQSEERFRTVYQNSPIGIELYGEDGKLVEINQAALDIRGVKNPAAMLGRDLFADPNIAPSVKEQVREGKSVRYDAPFDFDRVRAAGLFLTTRSGVIWTDVMITPLSTGYLLHMQDITERKQADRIKDEFLGLVSHELKTPLTIITGDLYTALLDGISEQEKNDLFKDAINGAERLAGIVDNMLELARMQADRLALRIESVDLRVIAGEVIARLGRLSSLHRIIIDIPSEVARAQADYFRVERILMNLVDNGIKYSPRGGEVRISARRQDGMLAVSVTDEGIGISAEHQKRLFEPFQRVLEGRNASVAGVGLGLIVCRRLVEALGGRIRVESWPGKGSVFTFTLPAAPPVPILNGDGQGTP